MFLIRGVHRGYFSDPQPKISFSEIRFPLADDDSMSESAIYTKPASRVDRSLVDFLAGQIACCPRQSQGFPSSQHKIAAMG